MCGICASLLLTPYSHGYDNTTSSVHSVSCNIPTILINRGPDSQSHVTIHGEVTHGVHDNTSIPVYEADHHDTDATDRDAYRYELTLCCTVLHLRGTATCSQPIHCGINNNDVLCYNGEIYRYEQQELNDIHECS